MLTQGVVLADRYRLEARVATGGMGAVWRCTDIALEREVALKVLLPALTEDPDFTTRFRAEARMLAALRHPGVVAVHDVGRAALADGSHVDFLVMEYVDGEPLGAWLRRAGRLDPASTMSVVAQAADALHAAHAAGIVHRDVKPGNLLVKRDGRVVLVDFGIARSGTTAGLTAADMMLGTASYMSPEQAANRPVSAASDIYALGAVAYACLAGRPPFDGDNPLQVALCHVQEEPAPLPPETPPAVVAVVERAMAKRPDDRWPDAAALAAAANQAREATLAVVPESVRPPWAVAGPSPAAAPFGPAGPVVPPGLTPVAPPGAANPADPADSGPADSDPATPPSTTGPAAASPSPDPLGPQPTDPTAGGGAATPHAAGPAPAHPGANPYPAAPHGHVPPAGLPAWQPSAYQETPTSPTLEEPNGRRAARRVALLAVAAAVTVVVAGTVTAKALLSDGAAAPGAAGGTPDPVASAQAGADTGAGPTTGTEPPASQPPTATTTPKPGRSGTGNTPPGGGPATGAPSPDASSTGGGSSPRPTPTTAAPEKPNPYTPVEACGSGYRVLDSAALTSGGVRRGRVYLLYHDGTGNNCVVTMKETAVGKATATTAWLEVQGKQRSTDSGSFAYYAGPVRAKAAGVCVKWGGSTGGASYGSGFEHCG